MIGPTAGQTNHGQFEAARRQPFGDEIVRKGDAACTIEGFVEVLLNIWNKATQN
jgi:hypothetical protein